MSYTDTLFFILFLSTLVLSALLRRWRAERAREWLIVGISLLLLATWGTLDISLFLAIMAANYAAVHAMTLSPPTRKRAILIAAIAADIALLSLFKYYGFFSQNMMAIGLSMPTTSLGIPLAISFYTFHIISYIVDFYCGRTAFVGIRKYMFYLVFFPHLIAGPIVRTWQLLPQLGRARHVTTDTAMGIHLMVTGAFLKSVAADNIAQVIDPVWSGAVGGLSGADHWIVASLYYCQIYADFGGYSLMALGMARLLGYKLPANFRLPMKAISLQEFWRRWHMTLSRWLKDYLYIPLGGNRGTRSRTALNLVLTMLLGGLWHGAGWGFIVWGAMHGVGLAVERTWTSAFGARMTSVMGRWLAVQVWVLIAWVFFRAPDVSVAAQFLWRMVEPSGWRQLTINPGIAGAMVFAAPVIAHHFAPWALRLMGRRRIGFMLGVATGLMATALLLVHSPAKTFIYFKF